MLETKFGEDHPALIKALSNLAWAYAMLRRYADAESTLSRALTIVKASSGTKHPTYGILLSRYASVLRRVNRKKEANEAEKQAKEILKSTDTVNLSNTTVDIGDLKRAK